MTTHLLDATACIALISDTEASMRQRFQPVGWAASRR